MSKKAVGLGGGIYDIKDNFPDGAPIDFELARIVDEEGNQIQATNHKGSRPLNKEEQQRILRVGTCIGCHGWNKMKITKKAPTDELHKNAIRSIMGAKK